MSLNRIFFDTNPSNFSESQKKALIAERKATRAAIKGPANFIIDSNDLNSNSIEDTKKIIDTQTIDYYSNHNLKSFTRSRATTTSCSL